MTSDRYVEALRALIARLPGGRAELASTLRANEQSLYQIVQGISLPSGRPRTVGRDLRERLDRHYPGWDSSLNTPQLAAAEQPAQYLVKPMSLQAALELFTQALARTSRVRWPAVAALLEQAVGHPEAAAEIATEVATLLNQESSKRPSAA